MRLEGVELDRFEGVKLALAALLDVDQAGDVFAVLELAFDERVGGASVGGVVARTELAQHHPAAVVKLHGNGLARRIIDRDFVRGRHEVGFHGRMIMLAREGVALGRSFVIVEGHAGRQHVDQGEAPMAHAGLDQRHELHLVAGEAARDESRAQGERQQDRIDRRALIDVALLGLRSDVRRRRKLALGESVDAVVLDQIEHVHVAPDRVHHLSQADGQRVAVAGNAHIGEIAIRGVGAARNRGHAPMDRVEAVRAADEIGRGLGRAADAGQLHQLFRAHVEPPARLDDRGGDRVVAATRAQGRHAALVLAPGHAERVGGERGMSDFRLVDE